MATMSSDSDRERARVFAGAKFAVDRLRLQTTDGKEALREVVVHPGAVVVLPLLDDGRVLMIRNHRFAVGETLWELPAGTLDAEESPAACADRELKEEAGYAAGRLDPLGAFYTSPGICTERMHAYLATELTSVGQDLEPTERIVVEPLAWDRVLEMARAGEIADGKTLVTLLRYQTFGTR